MGMMEFWSYDRFTFNKCLSDRRLFWNHPVSQLQSGLVLIRVKRNSRAIVHAPGPVPIARIFHLAALHFALLMPRLKGQRYKEETKDPGPKAKYLMAV